MGLCLHTGGKEVTRDELSKVPTPETTKSYVPIPHHELITMVESELKQAGYNVTGEQHALNNDGQNYFAVFNLEREHKTPDYNITAGIRNSHNKKIPAGLCLGSHVFVCDNLAFSGEVVFARRHTKHIMRDLPGIIKDSMLEVDAIRVNQELQIDTYKTVGLTDPQVHDILIRAMDLDAINLKRSHLVLANWRKPLHNEFEARNVWSLFNAFTEVYKQTPVDELPSRSLALHSLMDEVCGIKKVA